MRLSSPRTRGPISTVSGIWVPAFAGTTGDESDFGTIAGRRYRLWVMLRPHQDAADERARCDGRGGTGERQALERSHGEISEGLRLERVGRPADRAGGLDRRGSEALCQHSHQGRIACAAAGDDPSRRRPRQRSEERRVGKEWSARGWPGHYTT